MAEGLNADLDEAGIIVGFDIDGASKRLDLSKSEIETVALPVVTRKSGMSISATKVAFDTASMWAELSDGRTLGAPLAWFPRLLKAKPAKRDKVEISRTGLHWDALDEDISIEGLLAGSSDLTKKPKVAV